MTAYNVLSYKLTLFDNWPGTIDYNLPEADVNGNHFTNAAHHNVATAKFPIGKKIGYFDNTCQGESILIYLRNQADTHATASALGQVGTHLVGGTWYDVSNAGDEMLPNNPPVVYLSLMTDAYFGWFWCGGVCPVDKTPLLITTNCSTKNGVAAGTSFGTIDATDPDRAGFDATGAGVCAVGFSLANDA